MSKATTPFRYDHVGSFCALWSSNGPELIFRMEKLKLLN